MLWVLACVLLSWILLICHCCRLIQILPPWSTWLLVHWILLAVHLQITRLKLWVPLMWNHSAPCIHSLFFYYIWRNIWNHLIYVSWHLPQLLLEMLLLITHLEYENQVLYNLLLLLMIHILLMLRLNSIQVLTLRNTKTTLAPTFVLNVLNILRNYWVIRMSLSIRIRLRSRWVPQLLDLALLRAIHGRSIWYISVRLLTLISSFRITPIVVYFWWFCVRLMCLNPIIIHPSWILMKWLILNLLLYAYCRTSSLHGCLLLNDSIL